ncbi:recombinase family protein [Corynebacterium pseudotuberculosis]|uniref:recombinase family protein n=1 Tax=Corynebacterium pseudotuberculosis TaxID=1719 RepID=UPI0002504620|nr:recombinase family protein [Corynebacterium pseudotuberculosis]AFB72979.1 helix-turn-helix domain-containing protein [Corynebacterium pseudotuberculosis 316]AMN70502.1 recombinase family protein [Corynebacterium pseudotuberculosis]AMN72353.1 transposase [Corynebacterium pseudotuberculosis]AMN73799.1 transposase [Corynebacterium pseudotuberculosis]AMN75456.1 transposase [Corynebacterium pseudotuberculosis]
MAVIGYQRVSSVGQNEQRQLDGIHVDEMFTDKASGKDANRPQLQAAIRYARKGDTFTVHSMDRLARNIIDLRTIVEELNGKGATVRFIKENLEFTGEDSPMSNLLLNMLGAVAEFERSMIKERQAEGIAIAKAEGKYKGRKPSLSPEQIQQVRQLKAEGESISTIAKQFGVSRPSIYRALERLRA